MPIRVLFNFFFFNQLNFSEIVKKKLVQQSKNHPLNTATIMLRRKPTRIPISLLDVRELDDIENERQLQNESKNSNRNNQDNKNQKQEMPTFQFDQQRSGLPKQQRIGQLTINQM